LCQAPAKAEELSREVAKADVCSSVQTVAALYSSSLSQDLSTGAHQ
jgi:hypothetical protein